jgi:hypothetical protein
MAHKKELLRYKTRKRIQNLQRDGCTEIIVWQ